MAVAVQTAPIPVGWLRGRTFDFTFIFGIAAIALLSGWAVVQNPNLFVPIFILDLWLLGYHHVISTYTRLCFDVESVRANRFLLFGLPPIVGVGVVALYFGIGEWTIPTLYLYWQWFHYTRQSYGVSQAYRRKAGGQVTDPAWVTQSVIYLLPLWGILSRSHQAPEKFLGMDLWVIPVPDYVVMVAGGLAFASVGYWVFLRIRSFLQGRTAPAYTLFVVSHLLIFFVGYILTADIDHGWLVINIWHNAQYILFVWLYNNNRFREGVDPKAKFLSTISQTRYVWLYFATCIAIASVVYFLLRQAVSLGEGEVLALGTMVFMAINFHHYVVDGVIWKLRRKPVRQTLGISE